MQARQDWAAAAPPGSPEGVALALDELRRAMIASLVLALAAYGLAWLNSTRALLLVIGHFGLALGSGYLLELNHRLVLHGGPARRLARIARLGCALSLIAGLLALPAEIEALRDADGLGFPRWLVGGDPLARLAALMSAAFVASGAALALLVRALRDESRNLGVPVRGAAIALGAAIAGAGTCVLLHAAYGLRPALAELRHLLFAILVIAAVALIRGLHPWFTSMAAALRATTGPRPS